MFVIETLPNYTPKSRFFRLRRAYFRGVLPNYRSTLNVVFVWKRSIKRARDWRPRIWNSETSSNHASNPKFFWARCRFLSDNWIQNFVKTLLGSQFQMGIQMSLKAINCDLFFEIPNGYHGPNVIKYRKLDRFSKQKWFASKCYHYKHFWSKCHQIHGTSNGNCFRELISGSNVTKTLLKLMLSFINSMKCRQNFPPAAGNFHQIPPFFWPNVT